MPRSFADRVAQVVLLIPEGRVTTYGLVALSIGAPRSARQVGHALNRAVDGEQLPAHRVVNRNGYLSGGWHFGHPEVMKALLRGEGVVFREEYVVDLDAHLWDPSDDRRVQALVERWDAAEPLI